MTLSDVFHLSVEERLRVVQALWDSVSEHPSEVPLTEEQKRELDRCYAEYLADPNEGSPWPEVKARLLARE